ncbi:MAG: hypothetical protein ACOYVG_09445 [Bacteroidota bacterium]
MNDLELIFSMLGEATTTAIVQTRNPNGFVENQVVAKEGGDVAGKARKDLEAKTGKRIVLPENYLPEIEKKKRIKDNSQ